MLTIQSFCFNPFQENTYLLYNEHREAIIIDPGMFNAYEQKEFSDFIASHQLSPKYLLNTHCHIDHVLGNKYCMGKYNLPLQIHQADLATLQNAKIAATIYSIPYDVSPEPTVFLTENDNITLGTDKLSIRFTPGHSSGSISFYCEAQNFVISGDVLFQQSIGRTDLPGGNFDTLINSIKTKLLNLPDVTRVYSGHGDSTNIGDERSFNPYLK
jgi:hydroxyacylglutathione hydrolase